MSVVRSLILIGLGLCLYSKIEAQSFSVFKQKLQTEAQKYKTNVPCEGETRKGIENLNELIWTNPAQNGIEKNQKIIESCKFVKSKGCPQQELKSLLDEIADFYRQGGNGSNPLHEEATKEGGLPVANISDSMVSPEISSDNTPTVRAAPYPFHLWTLTIVTSLLALVCGWLIMRALRKPNTAHIQSNQTMNNELLEKLGDNNLIEILKKMRDELSVLRSKVAAIEGDLQDIKSETKIYTPTKITNDVSAEAEVNPVINIRERNTPSREDSQTPPPIVNPENTRYALYMDNSEGFSASTLNLMENHETIYQITMNTSQNATYRVSLNSDAQAYALSDPGYYLRTACDYDNSPTSGKHIETLSEGSLELVGNVWKIIRRARIRFV